jgi:predicted ATP-binding protein involved in virulence
MKINESKWVPWLDGILVKDCFVIQDLAIKIAELGQQVDAPRHLILTGRNGSGKSSILRALDQLIAKIRNHKGLNTSGKTIEFYQWDKDLLGAYQKGDRVQEFPRLDRYTYACFYTDRNRVKEISVDEVEMELKRRSIFQLESVGMEFERFMLSLKFSSLDSKDRQVEKLIAYYDQAFDTLIKVLRKVFEDDQLTLDYYMQKLTFSFIFGDKRNVNVRDLADGHFSFVMIILNLFARQEEIRREKGFTEAHIPGLVLIDEPEFHLHLDLQYQIMPLLTEMFPKVQFIVATHSPAVISSIRNATVYDLSKREYAPSTIAGESFSSLMETHFGLENEFGPIADKLFAEVKKTYLNGGTQKQKVNSIRHLMLDYEDILTPSLRVELESTIYLLEAEAESVTEK